MASYHCMFLEGVIFMASDSDFSYSLGRRIKVDPIVQTNNALI
jgi:hypothetical protein